MSGDGQRKWSTKEEHRCSFIRSKEHMCSFMGPKNTCVLSWDIRTHVFFMLCHLLDIACETSVSRVVTI